MTHKFKVGDRVRSDVDGDGVIDRIDVIDDGIPYRVERDDGRFFWATEKELTLAPSPATPQPPPTGTGREIADLVVCDILARRAMGVQKYGTPLRANNGRDALTDAYQEALDLACYLRQAHDAKAAPRSRP